MTDLEHMTRTAEHTEAAALADLMVSVPPATSAPDGLTGWLESRNVRRHNRWVRLWHPVDTPLKDTPQTDLRVTEIGPADADEFARVVRDAYGFPPEVD